MTNFNLCTVDPSWQECIEQGLKHVDATYLTNLSQSSHWLPGPEKIFNAFSLPLTKVNYILFGESPYPRAESANGYAFWDAKVDELWSSSGLTKTVNRATSLRNIIKMLLIAEERLDPTETTQEAIAQLDKHHLVQTGADLFMNFIKHGFLLLNATPVLQPNAPLKDARAWQPFTKALLNYALDHNPHIQFILFGNIANAIKLLFPSPLTPPLCAEHPYNLSFIHNPQVLQFFKPLKLMQHE